MDDNAKAVTSFKLDQEILDARGINMTVEEVAGLSTCKYADRVRSLQLSEGDLAFLKGLRRRIKNRLASQNSRRRNVEYVRKLTKELRAVRACRHDAVSERLQLMRQRDSLMSSCERLRRHIAQILEERCDSTELPHTEPQSQLAKENKLKHKPSPIPVHDQRLQNKFECRIDKLVAQSVNHIYERDKKVTAKTVFLKDNCVSDIKSMVVGGMDEGGVLNLSLKPESRRKSHGRKQSAPRRIAYAFTEYDDNVLDLKIKKESQ